MVPQHSADTRRTLFALTAIASGILLYGITCAPGVLWQDSAMFQFRVWHGDLSGDLGLPLAHPLYILLAKAFSMLPLGSIAFRVNLFSAVCGAACLGFAIDLLLSLTRSRTAAIAGTALLAVSHTFWTHAVIAEVYELYALGLLAELWLLERFFTRSQARWLILALFINGLNTSNHLLALLHAPAYAGIVIWALRDERIRAKQLLALPTAFLLGSGPYLALIVTDIAGGQPVLETLKQALVGPPQRADKVLTYSFPFIHQTLRAGQYFVMNFPTPLAIAAPVGAWLAWKEPRIRWFTLVAGSVFVVSFLFAFRYRVPDQYVFFFPCYVLLPLFAAIAVPTFVKRSKSPSQNCGTGVSPVAYPQDCGTGVSPVVDHGRDARATGVVGIGSKRRKVICLMLAFLPVAVYEAAPPLMASRNISVGVKRDIPFRDTYAYFLRPRKNGNDGAARFARIALAQAEPDGLLIADTTIMNVLVYSRDIDGIGRGVSLILGCDITPAPPTVALTPHAVKPFAERGAAYVCSNVAGYVKPWIIEEYDLIPSGEPLGVVFRLQDKSASLRVSYERAMPTSRHHEP